MSLVGPRPKDPGFVARRRADYAEILRVKPGITGLSQLAFVREAEIIDSDNRVDDYLSRLLPQKIALDCLYVRQRSTLMDVRIYGLDRGRGGSTPEHRGRPFYRQAVGEAAAQTASRPCQSTATGMTASIYPLTNDFSLRLPGRDAKAVVLVGGKGTRLAPYTSVLPKPLMPIGNHSILEIVLRQLHRHGVVDVTLCVGYLSHLIEEIIPDGSGTRGLRPVRARVAGARHGGAAPPRPWLELDVYCHERRRPDGA